MENISYKLMRTENLVYFVDEYKFNIRSLQRSIDTINSLKRDYKIKLIKCDTNLSSVINFYQELIDEYEERVTYINYIKNKLEDELKNIESILSERNIIVDDKE